jgi:hypothetical protein
VAIDAPLGLQHFGRVVPFFIETGGKGQDVLGAELDTIAAPLAPIFDDVNHTLGNLNGLGIQWYAPELHLPLPMRHLSVAA